MKYFITGADGVLAHYFRNDERYDNHIAFRHNELDIGDADSVEHLIKLHSPDVVINCAAYANPIQCESNPVRAEVANAIGVMNLAESCKNHNALLVHFSTNCVFDALSESKHDELAEVNTHSVYGMTKSAGESALIEGMDEYLILRISWVFGLRGRSFISRISEFLQAKPMLSINDEQIGKATYAVDIVNAVSMLMKHKKRGLYHFANKGEVTRCGIAEFVNERIGANSVITPVNSDYFDEPIRHPKRSILNTDKYEKEVGQIRTWQEAYLEYIKETNQEKDKV